MPSCFIQEIWRLMMRIFLVRKLLAGKLLAISLAVGAAALLLGTTISAQPTGGRILTDIALSGAEACRSMRIGFSLPIRYLNHFPQKRGTELRIQLKPLRIDPADSLALLDREAFSPVDDTSPLDNVIYEGDMAGGPYLSLQFSRSVYFTVAQGTDFRSMNVSFGDNATNCSSASSSPP